MHITFLNPQGNFDPLDSHLTDHPDFGGQLVYVKELTIQLGRLGHKVDILTRRIEDPEWPEFSDAEDGYPGQKNVRILRFPCGPKHFLEKEDLWPYIAEWVDNVRSFYKAEGSLPDIHTAHYADGGLAGTMINELDGTPFTFTSHSLGAQKLDRLLAKDMPFDEAVEKFHFDKRLAAERCAVAHAELIITSSEKERLHHLAHKVYRDAIDVSDDSRFKRIPPGVNLDIFAETSTYENEQQVATLIEETLHRDIPMMRRHLPMVVCSSRLVEKKNIIGLVRAWAHSETLMASANLLISVTGDPYPFRAPAGTFTPQEDAILDELRELIDERNLWPCVMTISLPTQHDLAAAYRHLAKNRQGVFALTAFHEPFGLSPLEALACGMPVVVTNSGGPAESLKDEAGVLVDPNDPDDIASGLLKLVQREDCWHSYREAGMARVMQYYTWPRSAVEYEKTLQQVVNNQPARRTSQVCPEWFRHPGKDSFPTDWLLKAWSR